MYHRLLVPLDGSPNGEQVLPYAVALAGSSAARLILLHVESAPLSARVDPWASGMMGLRDTPVADGTATGGANEADQGAPYLDRIAARLEEQGLAVDVLLTHGHAGNAILSAAREHGADLIAMSTHQRAGLHRWVFGSVADHVLRHARVPVLVVPPGCPDVWPVGESPCVVVPLDGSALADAALDPACRLAALLGAALLLVTVVEPALPTPSLDQPDPTDLDPTDRLASASGDLQRTAAELRLQGFTVTTQAAVGVPWSVIAAVAREHRAAAIVLATHGRSGLPRLLMGSVATALLRHGGQPLLLVRPPAVHESADQVESLWAREDDAALLSTR